MVHWYEHQPVGNLLFHDTNDLLQAQMKAKNSEEIPYALIAELAEIDGQALVYEDILDMDLPDVIALQSEISGKFQTAKPVETQKAEAEKTKTEVIQSTSPTVKA